MSNNDAELILDCIPSGYVHIQCEPLAITHISKKAEELLKYKCENDPGKKIDILFRLENEQVSLFNSWVKVGIRLYKIQDWSKICAIAPIQNVNVPDTDGTKTVTYLIKYYPVTGNNRTLMGIVAEIHPCVETQTVVHSSDQMVQQRENEVKAILSIANTPWDDMRDFISDTAERLTNLEKSIGELEEIYVAIRAEFDSPKKSAQVAISQQLESIYIDTIFRHLHTIKGNALTYEFEDLAQFSHEAESLASQLRQPASVRRTDVIKSIRQLLEKIQQSFNFLISLFEKLFGSDEERTVRLPLERIETINSLCAILESQSMPQSVNALVHECSTLSWKTLGSLTRKYGRVIYSRAVKLGKQIEFIVENSYSLVEPELFKNLDDSLLQIVANAVVHGIEDNETRVLKQKGSGHIRLSYQKNEQSVVITVADDGQGIRTDLLVEQFVNKGLLTREAAEKMSEEERIRLIFLPRSSTAVTVTKFAGRGVGMDVVDNKVKALGGTIKVTTEPGKGTKFVITIPITGKDAAI